MSRVHWRTELLVDYITNLTDRPSGEGASVGSS
jgi:hypothetical protein